ncbi:PRC-barrel domain-containing protein [Streptomyces sp. NPDC048142]|uniref:PRC-barrel domain-containing protein n=1 Tax=Streptomyces sp. NPDC048142 TaxID=3365501 RepID=UPI0037119E55
MLLSQIRGMKVVSATDAVSLATVTGIVIDSAPAARVAAICLTKNSSLGPYLDWDAVQAVGHDAVIAHGAKTPRPGDERMTRLAALSHDLPGRRVLTDRGEPAGTVKDIAFDPETGLITRIHLTADDIPGDRLIAVGSYALMIRTG